MDPNKFPKPYRTLKIHNFSTSILRNISSEGNICVRNTWLCSINTHWWPLLLWNRNILRLYHRMCTTYRWSYTTLIIPLNWFSKRKKFLTRNIIKQEKIISLANVTASKVYQQWYVIKNRVITKIKYIKKKSAPMIICSSTAHRKIIS